MNTHDQMKSFTAHKRPIPAGAESGQVIVFMALVMIALIGMLGLALDGGGLFFLWRDAQNATDAAVLAASYARCTGGDVVAAGLLAAEQNGFNNNGVSNTVTVENPPSSGEGAGNDSYIAVKIRAEKPSYFIHIVYKGPLEITNQAVGYCNPPFDPSMVPGLWAGSTTCPDTVNWTGSSAYLEGGMFSNNEIKIKGSGMTVVGPAESVGPIEGSNKVTWDPAYPPKSPVPEQQDPLHIDFNLYRPGGAVWNVVTLHKEINDESDDPDFHIKPQGSEWSPKNRTLEGLYYVEGNVSIGNSNGLTIGPKGITIIATGEINTLAGSFRYYDEIMNVTAQGVRYPGIVFATSYQAGDDGCGDKGIDLNGNSVWVRGIVYAPKSVVKLSGSTLTLYGSVIGNKIDYSSSNGYFIYEGSLLPPRPPNILVAE